MMDFILKLMDFTLSMMDFILKLMDFTLNMMEFLLKLMDWVKTARDYIAWGSHYDDESVSENSSNVPGIGDLPYERCIS